MFLQLTHKDKGGIKSFDLLEYVCVVFFSSSKYNNFMRRLLNDFLSVEFYNFEKQCKWNANCEKDLFVILLSILKILILKKKTSDESTTLNCYTSELLCTLIFEIWSYRQPTNSLATEAVISSSFFKIKLLLIYHLLCAINST